MLQGTFQQICTIQWKISTFSQMFYASEHSIESKFRVALFLMVTSHQAIAVLKPKLAKRGSKHIVCLQRQFLIVMFLYEFICGNEIG